MRSDLACSGALCCAVSRVLQDCFYVDYVKGTDGSPGQDIFFFDYGVVACWGMTKNQERTVVRGIAAQVRGIRVGGVVRGVAPTPFRRPRLATDDTRGRPPLLILLTTRI
jgi:hypothetical protein